MGHKLLLADDSITIQKVVGIIFSGEAYDLTVVDNGNDALVRAREAVPDIMLIDALMPGKNGYEVCRETRIDPVLSAVPILLLTGVFEPFDETKARESGADDFIAKPFESQVLIDKVKELISLGAARKAAPPAVPVAPPLDTHVPESAQMALDDAKAEDLKIEEVTSLDDLWGMDLFEEKQPAEIPFGVIITQQQGELLEGVEELEPFVVDEEPPVRPGAYDFTAVPQRSGEAVTFEPVTPDVVSAEVPSADEKTVAEFVFEVESDEVLPLLEEAEEAFSFEESVVVVEPFAVAAQPQAGEEPLSGIKSIEAEILPEPIAAISPPTTPAIQEPPLPAPASVAAGAVFTEEQLVAALSIISREVIERIVWEVVPDLAEALIKEEIRKIREGV